MHMDADHRLHGMSHELCIWVTNYVYGCRLTMYMSCKLCRSRTMFMNYKAMYMSHELCICKNEGHQLRISVTNYTYGSRTMYTSHEIFTWKDGDYQLHRHACIWITNYVNGSRTIHYTQQKLHTDMAEIHTNSLYPFLCLSVSLSVSLILYIFLSLSLCVSQKCIF